MSDLQNFFDNLMATERAKTFAVSPQLTLGQLIQKFELVKDKTADVYFDFENFKPTGISSWRGSYNELALEFDGNKIYNVKNFITLLKSAIGKKFTGYKGGKYIMSLDTPVWVANYGNSGNTGVIDVLDLDYLAIILTTYCKY
jgi:hypothetical protein